MDGTNVYTYVRGNPVRLHDLTGMDSSVPLEIPDLRTKGGQERWHSMTAREQMAAARKMTDEQLKTVRRYYGVPEVSKSSVANQAFEQVARGAQSTRKALAIIAIGAPVIAALGLAFGRPILVVLASQTGQVVSSLVAFEAIANAPTSTKTPTKKSPTIGDLAMIILEQVGVGTALGVFGKWLFGPVKLRTQMMSDVAAAGGGSREGFVRVRGQETVRAPEYDELLQRSVRYRTELSMSEVTEGVVTKAGTSTSVGIPMGPEVTSTLHTHPVSKVAMFSAGDIKAFKSGGYAGTTTHSVVGDKWPQARAVLEAAGAEPPPLEAMRTFISQAMLHGKNISKQTIFSRVFDLFLP